MSVPPPLSRRSFLAIFAALPGVAGWAPRGIAGPRDQGIGGTGATSGNEDDGDRGIGGTGVIGTIRRFGSIIVNDLRIAYPKDVTVKIDGEDASAAALKIGQVVRVVAVADDDHFSTRRINVTSEVVGRVEKTGAKSLTVLSQTVSIASLPPAQRRWSVGDHVAISGLRRPDGSIVASLIEKRGTSLEQVAGPVAIAADGSPMVGGLKLTRVDPGLIGQRAVLRGRLTDGAFNVAHGESERTLIGSGVSKLSIEAYVERQSNGLRLGSGLPVDDGAITALPLNRTVLAVLETGVGRGGEWRVNSVRFGGGAGEPGHSGPPPGNGGSNGGSNGPSGGKAGAPNGVGSPGSRHLTPLGPHGSFENPGGSTAPGRPGALGGFGTREGAGIANPAGQGGFGPPGGGPGAAGFGAPGGFGGPTGGPAPGGFGGPGGGFGPSGGAGPGGGFGPGGGGGPGGGRP
ncbi:DUF5666 domain-containing protein [Methylocella tundrae]|uniref:DUF5666 domain-containing protein n=1 Tax=Methylocella tundrae TaxID=227605 RepID=UPI0030FEBBA4|nr:DUF5666 domain-containing protein [Methylocella tundrae]